MAEGMQRNNAWTARRVVPEGQLEVRCRIRRVAGISICSMYVSRMLDFCMDIGALHASDDGPFGRWGVFDVGRGLLQSECRWISVPDVCYYFYVY
jgi:hypothetical protein